jgi:hypothetical protein
VTAPVMVLPTSPPSDTENSGAGADDALPLPVLPNAPLISPASMANRAAHGHDNKRPSHAQARR